VSKKSVKYIVECDYKTEIEASEIDFDLQNKLKINNNDSNMGTISNGDKMARWSGESFSIDIDRVIKILNQLKTKNKCKYVQIMYHVDHIGYVFNGLNITKHIEGSIGYRKLMNKIVEGEIDKNDRKIKLLEDELERLKSGK